MKQLYHKIYSELVKSSFTGDVQNTMKWGSGGWPQPLVSFQNHCNPRVSVHLRV